MDPERQRIQDDLRGLIAGDVRCDDVFLQLFASDASFYELKPLAVVRPRNTADVAAVVSYAAEKAIPIHARGAGTGLAGESLGRGSSSIFRATCAASFVPTAIRSAFSPAWCWRFLNQYLQQLGADFWARSGQQQCHHHRQRDRDRWLRAVIGRNTDRPGSTSKFASGAGRRHASSSWAAKNSQPGSRLSRRNSANGNGPATASHQQRRRCRAHPGRSCEARIGGSPGRDPAQQFANRSPPISRNRWSIAAAIN